MLGLKANHVSKSGPWYDNGQGQAHWYLNLTTHIHYDTQGSALYFQFQVILQPN